VKLLLDENLSRRLVLALQSRFPGSTQVALLGMEHATDGELCAVAARESFVICSKDDDFYRLVAARGYRPKLVHLALGNVSNERVLSALLAAADAIEAALSGAGTSVVVVD
jgi:predicted nuclease of predicted toxin-antitoxin system